MRPKKILIVIVRRGYLEIEMILPVLKILKKEFFIYFFFLKEESFISLKQQQNVFNDYNRVSNYHYVLKKYDLFYYRIIFNLLKFLKIKNYLFLNNFSESNQNLKYICSKLNINDRSLVKLILTEYNNHSSWIRNIFMSNNRPRIIFYPSSFVISYNYQNKILDKKKLFADILLVNSKYEIDYWSNFISREKIKVLSPPIFRNIINKKILKKKNKTKNILFLYNCLVEKEKHHFKNEINYIILLLKKISYLPNVKIFIKLHPFKRHKYFYQILRKVNSTKIILTEENLISLVPKFDLVLCPHRTAVISYGNLFKVPVIGYDQVNEVNIKSMYVRWGTILKSSNLKELIQNIKRVILYGKNNLYKVQNKNFWKLYKEKANTSEVLKKILKELKLF
jgi:hypothetical protein